MKYFELDKEEEQILKDFESGKLVPVTNFDEEKKKLRLAAKLTLNKTRNINIRLSERDLLRLKAQAIREGLPYQTLAASILRKSVTSNN